MYIYFRSKDTTFFRYLQMFVRNKALEVIHYVFA